MINTSLSSSVIFSNTFCAILLFPKRILTVHQQYVNPQPQVSYHHTIFFRKYLLYRITRIARFARPQNLHTITSPSNSIPIFQAGLFHTDTKDFRTRSIAGFTSSKRLSKNSTIGKALAYSIHQESYLCTFFKLRVHLHLLSVLFLFSNNSLYSLTVTWLNQLHLCLFKISFPPQYKIVD